jgi:hypothetical protein
MRSSYAWFRRALRLCYCSIIKRRIFVSRFLCRLRTKQFAISFAIRIFTNFCDVRSWSFETKCQRSINIVSRSCIARLQICCRTNIFSTKYLWFWMMILRKSCLLCRAIIAKRLLTRTFNNVFFDRVFVNWFCDKICECVTKSQINSSQIKSNECFTSSRFTIVLSFREKFRKWMIYENSLIRFFSRIWWWTRIMTFLLLTIESFWLCIMTRSSSWTTWFYDRYKAKCIH